MIGAHVPDPTARETLERHFEKLEKISTSHDEFKEVIKKLQEENKSLKKKVTMFESEKIQIRLCAFCKDYYTPLNNSEVYYSIIYFSFFFENWYIYYFINKYIIFNIIYMYADLLDCLSTPSRKIEILFLPRLWSWWILHLL